MPRFLRAKKRMAPKMQLALDDEVKAIATDPLSGELKAGALKGVRVRKFKVGTQLLLLAYTFDDKENRIELWVVGPHENFYRDLTEYRESTSRK